MFLKSIVSFFIVQLLSLNLVHRLTQMGKIEYSIVVNITLMGILSFFWPWYIWRNVKSVSEKKWMPEISKAILGIALAIVIDYFLWLLNVEPNLRTLDWKNGLLVATMYFAVSIITLLILFGVGTRVSKDK
ncbi:hypothetical protein KJ068_24735 [bacterium]|nr:hypothetical protein [bacterium]